MTEEEFWAALVPLPDPPKLIYRLYYNDQGEPIFYSMEDVPGKYVDISLEMYTNPPSFVRIVDGKLIITNNTVITKLKPNGVGTSCHLTNVSIVVDESQPHTKWSLA